MTRTVLQFINDLRVMRAAYHSRLEAEIDIRGKGAEPLFRELDAKLSAAAQTLDRVETLAPFSDLGLAQQNQTLGIIQEAEADFNGLRDAEDLVIKIRRFETLTRRFLAVIE